MPRSISVDPRVLRSRHGHSVGPTSRAVSLAQAQRPHGVGPAAYRPRGSADRSRTSPLRTPLSGSQGASQPPHLRSDGTRRPHKRAAGQLALVIRDRLFGANLTDRRNSLVAALHVRRLTQVMTRYLDRALRFGYLDADLGRAQSPFSSRRWIVRTPSCSVSRRSCSSWKAKVVRGEARARGRTQSNRPVRDHLAARKVCNPARDVSRETSPEHLETVLGGRDGGPPDVTVEPVDTPVVVSAQESIHEDVPLGGVLAAGPNGDEGPDQDDVLLLGMAVRSRQFGIVGSLVDTGNAVRDRRRRNSTLCPYSVCRVPGRATPSARSLRGLPIA